MRMKPPRRKRIIRKWTDHVLRNDKNFMLERDDLMRANKTSTIVKSFQSTDSWKSVEQKSWIFDKISLFRVDVLMGLDELKWREKRRRWRKTFLHKCSRREQERAVWIFIIMLISETFIWDDKLVSCIVSITSGYRPCIDSRNGRATISLFSWLTNARLEADFLEHSVTAECFETSSRECN